MEAEFASARTKWVSRLSRNIVVEFCPAEVTGVYRVIGRFGRQIM